MPITKHSVIEAFPSRPLRADKCGVGGRHGSRTLMAISSISVAQNSRSTMASGHPPPALPGLPLLGNAIQFLRDPIDVVKLGYERFGRVFSIRLGLKPIAILLGPENHRFFFAQNDTIFSLREVYQFVIPMFGEVFQAAEPQESKEQRSMILP